MCRYGEDLLFGALGIERKQITKLNQVIVGSGSPEELGSIDGGLDIDTITPLKTCITKNWFIG